MSGFEIKLSDEQVMQAVNQAIVQMLDDDAKTELIQHAIEHLTKDRIYKDGYTQKTGPSPVMEAFNREIERLAREEMAKQLENRPEVWEALSGVVAEAIATEVTDRKGFWFKVATRAGSAFEDWLQEERGSRW